MKTSTRALQVALLASLGGGVGCETQVDAGTTMDAGSANTGGADGVQATSGGESASGGDGTGGTAPATGGSPSSGGGGLVSGGGSGGESGINSDGSGSGGDVSAPMSGPLFPPPGSTQLCPDPTIRIRFDSPPTLGNTGKLRIYDEANSDSAVATIDMAVPQIKETIAGTVFNLVRPAYVHENDAIFVLPYAGLSYGHSYYITLDAGVVFGQGGIAELSDPSAWRFTVAPSAPADVSSLRVALDGSGQFCTVQKAIDAANSGSVITLAQGAYYGIVYFKNKNDLTLLGEDRASTKILGINNDKLNSGTRSRALFGLENVSGLTIEKLTIENQTPQGGSQAEALAMLNCNECVVRDATIKSLQDTLLWSGKIYADGCLIEGNVDYIWGTGAAYFNQCELKTVGRSGYNVQARNPSSGYGYVFVDSKLTADPGITDDVLARIDVSQYPASQVAYIDCEMGSHISAAGWVITGGANTSMLRFEEFHSKAPDGSLLSTSGRAAGSHQLSAQEAASLRDPTLALGGWDPRK